MNMTILAAVMFVVMTRVSITELEDVAAEERRLAIEPKVLCPVRSFMSLVTMLALVSAFNFDFI